MEDKDVAKIAEALLRISQRIEQDQFGEASGELHALAAQHPDWIDVRLRAEMQLIMKEMEYKVALKDFRYLRSIALVYRYLELNFGGTISGMASGSEKGKKLRIDALSEAELTYAGSENKEIEGNALSGVVPEDSAFLPDQDTIWWCWLQGLEQAPKLVKKCYQSLAKLGKKIVVLDQVNIAQYVTLPAFIWEKYQAGVIGMAHFSDLVRLELLTTRGGTWIDATTWISGTERISPLLEEEDLFFYRAGNVSQYIIFDNWFMHARKKSRILEATKRLLYAYWKQETTAKHYFIFQLMMTYACQHFREEYESIPLFSNEPCHVLQHELGKPFREKRWRQICEMSDVHKLTYQLDGVDEEGSFLGHLLS